MGKIINKLFNLLRITDITDSLGYFVHRLDKGITEIGKPVLTTQTEAKSAEG